MGVKRTCKLFKRVGGVGLRCAKFRKGPGHPVCDTRLKDGGRSPGLVRGRKCSRSHVKGKRSAPSYKARKAKRKSAYRATKAQRQAVYAAMRRKAGGKKRR